MTAAGQQPSDRRGLRVGAVAGVTVTKWTRIWAERFPGTPLEIVDVEQRDQRTLIDEGAVDMCFVREPIERGELHLIPLYEEVAVVVVAKDHPASVLDQVTVADLAEEDQVDAGQTDAETDTAFDLVAGGAGVLLVPHSIARSHSRRDLAVVPIVDGEPTRIGLAWLAEHPNALIEEFVGVVRGRTANSTRSPSSANHAGGSHTRGHDTRGTGRSEPDGTRKRAAQRPGSTRGRGPRQPGRRRG